MHRHLLFIASVILLSLGCRSTYHAVRNIELLDVSASIPDAPSVYDSIIAPYKGNLDAVMDEVIAFAPVTLYKERPAGTLNQWFATTLLGVCDSIYDGRVDIALQNYGGLRVPEIGKGDITVRTIYEVMPFENTIVILQVTGDQLMEIMDRIASDNGWPGAGFTMTIRDKRPIEVLVGGEEIQPDRAYTVALPDYVANGGNGSDYLVDWPRVETGALIRDAMIDYLRQQYSDGNGEIIVPVIPNIKRG